MHQGIHIQIGLHIGHNDRHQLGGIHQGTALGIPQQSGKHAAQHALAIHITIRITAAFPHQELYRAAVQQVPAFGQVGTAVLYFLRNIHFYPADVLHNIAQAVQIHAKVAIHRQAGHGGDFIAKSLQTACLPGYGIDTPRCAALASGVCGVFFPLACFRLAGAPPHIQAGRNLQHLQLVPVTVPLQIQDHIRQADLFFAVLRRTVIPGHHQADGTCIRLRRVGLAGQQLADGVYTRCSRRCFMPGIPSFRQPNGRQHCQQYQDHRNYFAIFYAFLFVSCHPAHQPFQSTIVICIISCTGIKVVAKDDQNVHKLQFLYTIKRYFSFFVKNAGKFHFFDCQILTSVEIKGILCIQKALVSLFPGDVLHMKEVSL